MSKNLFQKVWDAHTVATLPNGNTQLFIGLHLIHEVTSPQAFAMLKEQGIDVMHPERTFATVDHIVPTAPDQRLRPFQDGLAEDRIVALKANCEESGITYYGENNNNQGTVHLNVHQLRITPPAISE